MANSRSLGKWLPKWHMRRAYCGYFRVKQFDKWQEV